MIRDLYEQHHAALLRVTTRRFGLEVAEDAVSRAWIIALEHQKQLAEHPEPFRWLIVVARHEAYALDKRARRAMPVDMAVYSNTFVALPELEDKIELREAMRALAKLGTNRRTAIAAKAVGISHGEVNTLRGTRSGGANTWLNRHLTEGRAQLRELVAREVVS